MKAAVMRTIGDPLMIEDVSIDDPAPGEVLVQVGAAGVCHSDLIYLDGGYSHDMPTILGHESAGVVLAAADDVTVVSPGDRVITTLSVSCGKCPYCLEEKTHLCSRKDDTRREPGGNPRLSKDGDAVHQFLDLSSFAEQILVHESTLVKIPQNMPLDRAALLGCGVATGLGAVFNSAAAEPGQSVAIIGCGGVGLAAVQGARIVGAEPIIAIDVIDEKLELAAGLGASHTINASKSDAVTVVREVTSGHGVHHAIEALGTTVTARNAFDMLRRGGTATIVGLIPDQTLHIPTDDLFYERRIQGSVMGSNVPIRDIPRYIDLYANGLLNLDDMVTRRIALSQLNEAFDDMRSGRAVRSVVDFG